MKFPNKTVSVIMCTLFLLLLAVFPSMASTGGWPEIVFIDSSLHDVPVLAGTDRPGIEVVRLNAGRDGIVQMADILKHRHGLRAIHLISHGAPGRVFVGTGELSAESLQTYDSPLHAIAQSLCTHGEILLYGCNVAQGATGERFAERLATVTKATVAASTDATGAASRGGNWVLEKVVGPQRVAALSVPDFKGLLATPLSGVTTFGSSTYYSPTVDASGAGYVVPDIVGSGWDFRVFASSPAIDVTVNVEILTSDTILPYGATNSGNTHLTSIQLSSNDGQLFDLSSVQVAVDGVNSTYDGSSHLIQLVGYRNGSPVAGATLAEQVINASGGGTPVIFDVSGNDSFKGIDAFRVEPTGTDYIDGAIGVDNVDATNFHTADAAPTVTNLNGDTVGYTEGASPVLLDSGADATATEDVSWNGGKLLASFAAGQDLVADLLGITNQGTAAGQIGVSGSYVTYGGTTIGTVGGGRGILPLTVTFNASATDAAVSALLRNLTFRTTNASNPSTAARTVRVTLADSVGNVSANNDITVTVTAVNNAPTFTAGSGSSVISTTPGEEMGYAAAVQPDGKVLVAGNVSNVVDPTNWVYDEPNLLLARYNADGSIDTSFATNGFAKVNIWTALSSLETGFAIAVLPDGKIVVGAGDPGQQNSESQFGVARFNADGSPDAGFGTNGAASFTVGTENMATAHGMTVDARGNILLVGESQWRSGSVYQYTTVLRVKPDGTLDTTFGSGGIATTNVGGTTDYNYASGIAVQPDGKIVVVGTRAGAYLLTVLRYNDDGTLDTSFGTGGVAQFDVASSYDGGTAVAIQSDGKILVGGNGYNGSNNDFMVLRLTATGSLDTSFNGTGKLLLDLGGDDRLSAVTIQSDGKILLSGQSSSSPAFARLTVNGTLDTSFDGDGTLVISGGETGQGTAVQGDGRIVTVGAHPDATWTYFDLAVDRLNADGSRDLSFGSAVADTLNATPSYTQGDAAIALVDHVTVFDTELSSASSYAGATLTLARSGGANANDLFSAAAGGTLAALTEGGDLTVDSTTIGTVTTNSGGTLLLTFTANATETLVDSAMRQIAYSNDIGSPSSVQIDWTFSDGNGGSQGTGGAKSATGSIVVSVISLNVAPTFVGGTTTLTVNQNASATDITGLLHVSDSDLGQTETWSESAAPSHGTLSFVGATASSGSTNIAPGGTITYTPTAGYAGSDSFTVQVSDGAATATRTITVTVNAVAPGVPTGVSATAGNGQATVSFTAPTNTGGASITGYTATSSPGGFTGTCASSPCTVGGLTNGTAYTFTVTATNSAGTGSASAASNSVTPKAAQTITFANPGARNFGTTPTLTATATSLLTVSFSSSTTGVCTITSGGALTFVTAGTCTINADQAGDSAYAAAPTVTQSFAVNAVVPGAPAIGSATAGDTQASVTFTAPASTGGATITGYTATSNPGGLTGSCAASPCTVTGLTNGTAYTFTVTATSSAGTGSASAASNSVTPKAAQTITFANPGAQNFGTTPTLFATATSSLTVSFSSSTTGVCTITSGGALTFISVGPCTIAADQAGNAAYLAAPTVSQSFAVNAVVPGAPVIGTASPGDTLATVGFTAPAFTGGAAITGYTATSNPGGRTGTCASSPCTVTGLSDGVAYTFTVTATNSAGTGSASAASTSVTPQASQTITFANPGIQNFGTTPTLTATATSMLPVSFSSTTTGVCTITTGGVLTFLTPGTCTINADQAGNSVYAAAPTVAQSFSVIGAPVISAGSSVTFASPAVAIQPSFAITSDGGAGSLTGATVTIGTGFAAGDVLNFTNQNGITGSYSAATGVLTLSGAATAATYQTAIRSITFGTTSFAPADTSRTISYTVSNGSFDSTTVTSTVTNIAVDTTLTGTPADPGGTNAVFSFTGSGGSGTLGYECQLDGGSWGACTSPQDYTGLTAGSHTFQVRAKDSNGYTDPTPVSFTWTVVPVRYATSGGATTGSCDSWGNGCGLSYALSGAASGQELWVKAGTYKPTSTADRTISFNLKSGVAIYGGFAGTETARSQRDPAKNVTILSGDLNGDDGANFANNGENSYHVVYASGVDVTAILDGVTVTGGNANGDGTADASNGGGGMFGDSNASPTVTNCIFSGNSGTNGGGMANDGNATVTNCTFSGNSGTNGGGMKIVGSPAISNCTFSGNKASLGGGMAIFGSPTVTGCTFSGNTAAGGGGIYLSPSASSIITDSILWGDTGGEIYAILPPFPVSNSIVQGGCPGGWICTNITDADPLLGPLGNYGGPTPILPLFPGSPAIGAGSSCPATDQRGVTRTSPCDMGAYQTAGFTLAASGGTNQSATLMTGFAFPLQVTLTENSFNTPLPGAVIGFTAPASGASATLSPASATTGADGTASVTATANDTPGSYTVTAATNGAGATADFSLTNTLIPQIINFVGTTPGAVVGGTSYTPTATGGASGNPVVFTIDNASTGICTISGGTVSFQAVGTCTIDANQAGTSTYAAAAQATQSFAVGKGSQTITFGAAPSVVVNGSGTVSATATSGLTVSFTTTTPAVCLVSGTTVTGLTAGTCSVAANQAGNANYNPAAQVTQSISIGKGSQTITFGAAPSVVVNGSGTVSATATSGLPVSFTTTTPAVCLVSGTTVTGLTAGTCSVAANQAGNANYNPAAQATQSFTVGKGSQTIGFGAAPSITVGGSGTVSATATSGLPVSFITTTPAVCSVSGTTVTGLTAGTCSVAANQAGNANYTAAAQVTQSFTVGKGSQTIGFGAAPSITVGGSGTVSATATSGLPVSFTSATPSVCSVSGTTVTGKALGLCTIAANQAGDANYSAAPPATQVIIVVYGTAPPATTLSTLSDHAVTADTTQNVSGTASDPAGIRSVTVNRIPVTVNADGSFSYPVQLLAGANTVTVVVTNNAGISSTTTRTITLDGDAPRLTVAAPDDNAVTYQQNIAVSGSVTPLDATTVVSWSVNGAAPQLASLSASGYTFTANLQPGMNTIRIVATNAAGQTVEAKRTVTCNQVFSLAVTDPAADIRTAFGTYTLTGTVADATTPVAVTVTMDGRSYTPAVVNGSFQQPLSFSGAKVYQVAVTGVDQNSNSVTVQRNIIYTLPTATDTPRLTVVDALQALRMTVGIIHPDTSQLARLDVAPMVNGVSVGDGKVDISDVIVILRMAIGAIH